VTRMVRPQIAGEATESPSRAFTRGFAPPE
jgi:hypothetical protein